MKAVNIQQYHGTLPARFALLLEPDLVPQVCCIGQLRDTVESAVLAEQALALGKMVVQHELFVAPVVDTRGEYQHPEWHQGFEPVVPAGGLVDTEELVQAIGPGTEHDGRQSPGQEACHQAARPAAQGHHEP